MKNRLLHGLGVQAHTSLPEKTVSLCGAVLGIVTVFFISHHFTGYEGAMAILPSMGAAAVLLFAVPHGPLSQPWALLLGNGLSAVVGVTCAHIIPDQYLAAAFAVGLAILVMHLVRAIHPPGGATALAAVIGGPSIHALGYGYVLVPTLLNCLVLLVMAVVFNYPFRWRRYPLGLMQFAPTPAKPGQPAQVQLHHVEEALEGMETLMDISAEEILQIMEQAGRIQALERSRRLPIENGAFYTNGKAGLAWSVRQVIDESPDADPRRHQLIYRTLEGAGKGATGTCSLAEFAEWAQARVNPARQVQVVEK